MKRKIVSVLVCAAMVATMAVGCGSSSSTDTSSDAAATTEDAAATDDAAATEDAAATDDAAAADGDVITVGFAQVGRILRRERI